MFISIGLQTLVNFTIGPVQLALQALDSSMQEIWWYNTNFLLTLMIVEFIALSGGNTAEIF